MSQQINLYLALPKKEVAYLSSRRILHILALLLILLLAVYVHQYWQNTAVKKSLQSLELKRSDAIKRLKEVSERYPSTTKSEPFKAEIAKLSQTASAKKQAIEHVTRTSSRTKGGFSPYLLAIAQKIPADTWLTAITIDNQGRDVTLTGKTTQSTSIPTFITGLMREKPFKNRSFETLRLTKPKKEKDTTQYLHFTISDKS